MRAALLEKHRSESMSLKQVADALGELGLATRAWRGTFEDLVALQRPGIVQVRSDTGTHFIVVEAANNRWVRLVENGRLFPADAARFAESFTGYLLARSALADSEAGLADPVVSVDPEIIEVIPWRKDPIPLTVANRGRQDRLITAVHAPIGWEVEGLAVPTRVEHGTELVLQLKPSARATEASGPVAVDRFGDVEVCSDDPVRPRVHVTLDMGGEPLLRATETVVDFGEGPLSELRARRRTLWIRQGSLLGEPYVEPREGWLVANLLQLDTSAGTTWGQEWMTAQIELQLGPDAPAEPGRHETEVLITGTAVEEETDAPVLRVPVWYEVWPPVRSHPPELFFGIVPRTGRVEESVEVIADRPDTEFIGCASETDLPVGAEARWETITRGRVRVSVAIPLALQAPGPVEGRLVLLTREGDGLIRAVEIPLFAFVLDHDTPETAQGDD